MILKNNAFNKNVKMHFEAKNYIKDFTIKKEACMDSDLFISNNLTLIN